MFTSSVIQTAFMRPVSTITGKFPNGELTATTALTVINVVIGNIAKMVPTQVIDPGVAMGVAGVG